MFAHYVVWYDGDAGGSGLTRAGWCAAQWGADACAGEGAYSDTPPRKQYAGPPPLIGEYDQRDAATMRYHIGEAAATRCAGVDCACGCNEALPV